MASRVARTLTGLRMQIIKATSNLFDSAPRRVYGAAWVTGAVSNSVLYFLAILALPEQTRGSLTVILSAAYLALVVIVAGRDKAGLLKLTSSLPVEADIAALFMRKTYFVILAATAITAFLFLVFPERWLLIVAVAASITLVLTAQEYLLLRESLASQAKFSRQVSLFHFLVILVSLALFVTQTVRLEMWLVIYALAGIPMVISVTRMLFKPVSGSLSNAAKEDYRELAALGTQLFPAELVQFLANRADRFLVAMTLGAGAVGKLIVFLVFFELLSYPLRILVTTSIPGPVAGSAQQNRSAYLRDTADVQLRGAWVFAFLVLSIGATALLLPFAGYSLSDPDNLLLLGAVSVAFVAKILLFSVGTALIRAGKTSFQFVSLLIASGLMASAILVMAPFVGLLSAPLAILIGAAFATWWAGRKFSRVKSRKNIWRAKGQRRLSVHAGYSALRRNLGISLQKIEQLYELVTSLKQKDSFQEMPRSGILFVSDDSSYAETTADGKKFNRLIDTLAIRLSHNGETFAHLSRPPSNLQSAVTHHPLYTANRAFALAFALDILTSLPPKLQIKHRVSFFKSVLRHVQPKAVFTTSARGYMWIAAKELNIPLAEVLHGIGYDDLSRTPTFSRKSSEGLPDYLIAFDETSSRSWGELSDKPGGLLRCQNFWLENFLNDSASTRDLPKFISPQVPKRGYAKRVLVSLTWSQPLDHASENRKEIQLGLLGGLLSTIEAAGPDIFWMLRVHPVQLNSKSFRHRRKTKELIMWSERFPNVEVRTSSSAPLPALLAHATHHVTWDSMSSYEAADFGLGTFALRPRGSEADTGHLRQLENEGYVVFGNASEILPWVASTQPTTPRGGWTWGRPVEDEISRLWSS